MHFIINSTHQWSKLTAVSEKSTNESRRSESILWIKSNEGVLWRSNAFIFNAIVDVILANINLKPRDVAIRLNMSEYLFETLDKSLAL